jgi:hypothetical protein
LVGISQRDIRNFLRIFVIETHEQAGQFKEW